MLVSLSLEVSSLGSTAVQLVSVYNENVISLFYYPRDTFPQFFSLWNSPVADSIPSVTLVLIYTLVRFESNMIWTWENFNCFCIDFSLIKYKSQLIFSEHMPPWEVLNLLLWFPLIHQSEVQISLGNSENTLKVMPKTCRENAFIKVFFWSN